MQENYTSLLKIKGGGKKSCTFASTNFKDSSHHKEGFHLVRNKNWEMSQGRFGSFFAAISILFLCEIRFLEFVLQLAWSVEKLVLKCSTLPYSPLAKTWQCFLATKRGSSGFCSFCSFAHILFRLSDSIECKYRSFSLAPRNYGPAYNDLDAHLFSVFFVLLLHMLICVARMEPQTQRMSHLFMYSIM
jgi:hypothetical protein